jgi:methionine sulfoxide reductase heme-binding subunit
VTTAAAVTGTTPLWLFVRASGTIDLVLLTASVALGVMVMGQGSVRRAPRFVFQHLHRDVSMIAVALLVGHVVASVLLLHLDVIPSVVPFTSSVRRVYLGLGVLAADLMAVLVVTSVVRRRLRLRRWRLLHWSAYLAWAAAVVHGAAPGTDRAIPWVGALDIACVLAVVVVAAVRLTRLPGLRPAHLMAIGGVAALALVAFVSWVHRDGPTAASSTHVHVHVLSPTITEESS